MADTPQLGPDPTTYSAAGLPPSLPKKLVDQIANEGGFIDHFTEFMGLKARSGKIIPGLNKLVITYLAPQPFGVVKPQNFGLPEDYLQIPFAGPGFRFTPTQVVEALNQLGPQELYNKLQFEKRRELLHQQLDKITAEMNLKQKTDKELETELLLTPDLGDPFDLFGLTRLAIKQEQNRRRTEQNTRERLGLPPITTPSIETRGELVTDPAHVSWPAAGGISNALSIFGFLDALAAALPPDP